MAKQKNNGSGIARDAGDDQEWDDILQPVGSVRGKTVNDRGGHRLNSDGGQVFLFFWGSDWHHPEDMNPDLDQLVSAFASILAGPYQTGVAEYGCSRLSYGGAYYSDGGIEPPDDFQDVDVQTRVMEMLDFNYQIPAAPAHLYVLVMPPGKKYNNHSVTGAHSYFADIRTLSNVYYAWIQYDTIDKMTSVFSHELVEAITDPDGHAIQVEPVSDDSWNEIGDVCESVQRGVINGVTVQAYWSARQNSCIIPQEIQVKNRQITTIKKNGDIESPSERIKAVGGISVESGYPFYITQEHCMRDIQDGMRYFVVGDDGSSADVGIFVHYPPWAPQGAKYIATVADNTKRDNLLSLPIDKRAVRIANP